jgi:hypothetical protein
VSDIYARDTVSVRADADQSAVSWPAIIAGSFAALGITMILLAFGSAVGFSSVSPWSNSGVSGTTFHIATGIYLIVVAMLASTIGGYIAGRLRTKWSGLAVDEVRFRDTAHGFLAWAFATVVGAALLGTAATYLVGGTISGVAAGATAVASDAASPDSYFVDMLFRPAAAPAAAAQAAPTPAAPVTDPTAPAPALPSTAPSSQPTSASRDPEVARAEATRIFAFGMASEDGISTNDRAYMAQLVAAETGISQAEAEARVAEVLNAATEAVDTARETAAAISIWLTISMLIGAFAASLAALEGGQHRDGTFRAVIFRRI